MDVRLWYECVHNYVPFILGTVSNTAYNYVAKLNSRRSFVLFVPSITRAPWNKLARTHART